MKVYDQVVELAKRRGFFWPSFSIYGGESGLYDYGPLGVLLRDNIVRIWKESYLADDAIFIDTPVIVPASVFRASGHLDKFADLATECSKCHNRQKLETVLEASGFHNIIKTVPEANEFLEPDEALARRNLIPEALSKLGHCHWEPVPVEIVQELEVDKYSLCGLRPEIEVPNAAL